MSSPPYDARAIANLIISKSAGGGGISNLALQKLLYFVHGIYLGRTRLPLIDGHFEAWQHGPVHPAVYSAFKSHGAEKITTPTLRRDIRTGQLFPIPSPNDLFALETIEVALKHYGNLTPGQLVELSHAKDGPWHVVFRAMQAHSSKGRRINNDLILERFKYHKATATKLDGAYEPYDDSPPSDYRLM